MNPFESLQRIKKYYPFGVNEIEYCNIEIIESALKALEIIKKKTVDVRSLNIFKTRDSYNGYYYEISSLHLTQEEYDLLKEVLL